jgi:hypothetical protein
VDRTVRVKRGRSSSVDVKCSITSSLLSSLESQDGASSAATGGLSLPPRRENCLSYSIFIYILFMSLTQNYCHVFWSIFCLLLRYYHVSATNEVVSRYHVLSLSMYTCAYLVSAAGTLYLITATSTRTHSLLQVLVLTNCYKYLYPVIATGTCTKSSLEVLY